MSFIENMHLSSKKIKKYAKKRIWVFFLKEGIYEGEEVRVLWRLTIEKGKRENNTIRLIKHAITSYVWIWGKSSNFAISTFMVKLGLTSAFTTLKKSVHFSIFYIRSISKTHYD